MDINGASAIVTGGASGIGAAAARQLAAKGAVVVVADLQADKGEARLENLEELVSAARGFEPEDASMSPLAAFLSHAVLESGEGQAEAWEDCVQMMTLHSAKGLEFPVVFLTAKAMLSEIQRLKDLGAKGVVVKPFDPLTLAREIRTILGA